MATIDNRTTIPLFAVIISMPCLIGGVIWLTSIDSKATQALHESLKETSKIEKIQESITRIEIKLGTLPKTEGE